MDDGEKLLKLIRQKHSYMDLTLDGYVIKNSSDAFISCQMLNIEIENLQRKISNKNKKAIKKECDEKGVLYPDFKQEV